MGIIVVKDLPPDYVSKRERLLKLADRFAGLEESSRDKYTDPQSRYRYSKTHICYRYDMLRQIEQTLVLVGLMARYVLRFQTSNDVSLTISFKLGNYEWKTR